MPLNPFVGGIAGIEPAQPPSLSLPALKMRGFPRGSVSNKRQQRRERGRLTRYENVAELTTLECCYLRIQRATEKIQLAMLALIEPAQAAVEAMQSFGIRLSGLSTVEIIYGNHPVRAEYECSTQIQPTACARCLYHGTSPLLPCAVHPLGRPGEVCGDWEDGAMAAVRP